MTATETERRPRRVFRAHTGAERAPCSGAGVRREGDPTEGSRVRRARDPPRGCHRAGARARPHESPRSRVARRARAQGLRRDARRRGAVLGLLGHRHLDRRERPRRGTRDHRREREAEGGVADAAPRRPDPVLVRAFRARRRLRRGAHEDDGRASRRRIRPQRLEDVHHERRPGVMECRVREDGPERGASGDLGVHRPAGHARRPYREAPGQDGPARHRHLGVRPGGRRRPGREPHRRGGRGLQDRDEDARLHAAGNCRRCSRRRAGRLRACRRVREGARHVRPPDRHAPGRQLPHRGHGGGDRGGAAPHVAGRVDARLRIRSPCDSLLVLREAVLGRHGDEGDDGRSSDLRRLRVHQGVPGGEADARREALPDLRGHVADPATRDREGDLPSESTTDSRPD